MKGTPAFAVIADAEIAGATPDENPVLHVDPYDAAKRIRELARQLRDETDGGVTSSSSASRVLLQDNRTRARMDLRRISDHNRVVQERLEILGATLAKLGPLVEQRKVKETRTLLSLTRSECLYAQQHARNISSYVTSSRIKSRYPEKLPPEDGDPAPNSRTREMAQQIHQLAQSLPTITNAPLGKAENTLRAIASVLKNNGYFSMNAKFNMHPDGEE